MNIRLEYVGAQRRAEMTYEDCAIRQNALSTDCEALDSYGVTHGGGCQAM